MTPSIVAVPWEPGSGIRLTELPSAATDWMIAALLPTLIVTSGANLNPPGAVSVTGSKMPGAWLENVAATVSGSTVVDVTVARVGSASVYPFGKAKLNTLAAPLMFGGAWKVRLRPPGATTMFCGPDARPASCPRKEIESIVGVNVTSGLSVMVMVTVWPIDGVAVGVKLTFTLSNCGLVILSAVAGLKTRFGVASVNTLVTVTGPSTLGGRKNEMVVPSGATPVVMGCSSAPGRVTFELSVNLLPAGAVNVTCSSRAGVTLLNVPWSSVMGTTCTGTSMVWPAPVKVILVAPNCTPVTMNRNRGPSGGAVRVESFTNTGRNEESRLTVMRPLAATAS